ncbi:MAG: sodium:calcium antiporter [Salinibacter sp.]|uniref:sodium:calcium antiporter n=1 Tax=Salinibacter sp. TaxID=2065818 RepID=UPI0035D3D95E
MALLPGLALFALGLVLVLFSAERLVDSTIGVSHRLGLSAFLISVVFIGFDPENLGVGAVASYEATAGIALGTIVGAAMVALALAFGLTALVVPLDFERAPRRILLLPVGAVALVALLAYDPLVSGGRLSRIDGAILLLGYIGAVGLLLRWERQGIHVAPTAAVEAEVEEDGEAGTARSIAWFGASLVGIVAGGELLVRGARPVVEALGWTDTAFGMTLLALLVSVEEVARELPAALRGRPDISFGNVVGSALAFFGFNAGIIALVRPVPVGAATRYFYLPVCMGAVLLITVLMGQRRVPRWGGVLLLLIYALFAAGPFVT